MGKQADWQPCWLKLATLKVLKVSKYIYLSMGILCDLNEIGLNGVKNMEKGN